MAKAQINFGELSGGGGTLTSKGLITTVNSTNSYQFTSDYDLVLVVTYSVSGNDYRPVYDGVTYDWKDGNGLGAAALIPNVKNGTSITFNHSLTCNLWGYNYE